ncbi:zinc ribbon domain-containing protein [Streptosporangium subroseum]
MAERTWTCAGCGAMHDREINASTNLVEALDLERGQVAT